MTIDERAARVSDAIESGIPGGVVMQQEHIAIAIHEAVAEAYQTCAVICDYLANIHRGTPADAIYQDAATRIRAFAVAEKLLADNGKSWGSTAEFQAAGIEEQREDIDRRYGSGVTDAMIAFVLARAATHPEPPPAANPPPLPQRPSDRGSSEHTGPE